MHLRELDANLIVILDALLLEASVTKAAERLGRSPSAVSHALARLRETFDDPLFVRAGQRLVPTSRATQLAPTVHIIVSGLEGLLHPGGGFDPRAQERCFTLACRDDLELTLLPAARAALGELAPGITLERVGDGAVVEALRAGRVDLAIVEGKPPRANDISAESLFDLPFIALAREGHGADGQTLTRPDGPPVFADGVQAAQLCAAGGQPWPAKLETVASPLIAVHAALERGGIALVPASVAMVAQRHTLMRAVPCDPALPRLACYLMWHLSMERDACNAWLREQLRCCADAIPQAAQPAPAPVEPA